MSQHRNDVTAIPQLGAGLGYRRELAKEIFAAKEMIDFVEIITDQYIEYPHALEELEHVCEVFQVIPHGVGLSVGSVTPLDTNYLRMIKHISDLTKSPYYSEHLCLTRVPGINIGHFAPLWFTEEVLDNVINKVSYMQDYLGKPLILENVTYLVDIPNGSMRQTDFFDTLVQATGCGVLLDITNLYINSVNHGFDPVAFLAQMPLERVVQVHVAGGYWAQGILIDGHSEPVQAESWQLLEILAAKTQIRGAILEHDQNFPDIALLLQQVERARTIINATRPGTG